LPIQHVVSSSSEDESEYINEDTDEDASLFITTSQEDLPDIKDDNIDNCIVEDVLDEPVDSNLDEKDDNDEEEGDVISNMFQNHIVDDYMQKSSSLPL
jgi:hypothetical protein